MEFTNFLVIGGISLLIALSLLTVTSISEKNQLQTEHQKEVLALQQKLDSVNKELTSTKENAQGKDSTLDRLQERLNNVESLQQQCNEANSNALEAIGTFNDDLKQKIAWLGANSQLDILPTTKVQRASDRCLKLNSNSCTVSMACIFAANKLDMGYSYIRDELTSGTPDKLQSLIDMDKNGGGDCEDWSILTAAQVRYLENKCPYATTTIETFVQDENVKDPYVISEADGWEYSTGFAPINLGDYPHVAIACGHMRISTNGQQATLDGSGIVAGHCLLIFTDEKITDKNVNRVTKNAPLVEPQLGNFYGRVSKKIQLINNNPEGEPTSLWMFVTEDNIVSNLNGEWTSYQTLLESIKGLS